MNFKISQEIDLEAKEKSLIILFLSDKLSEYLNKRDYGRGVQNFFIGCICVKPREGYEEWFKIRKPKYKELVKIKLLDNSIKELKGVFSYDINLNFDVFVNNTDIENKKLLASEILNSLSNLDNLPKRVKDFDKEKFKSDLEFFFKDQNLI
ncbi:Imm44 family immunity protein [Brumimicrobium sp.]|uniref:Imm44 family immunity protein n=1 Tax=Brumimicrobium sp. TaxID=2029867 RepID=UPI003A918581